MVNCLVVLAAPLVGAPAGAAVGAGTLVGTAAVEHPASSSAVLATPTHLLTCTRCMQWRPPRVRMAGPIVERAWRIGKPGRVPVREALECPRTRAPVGLPVQRPDVEHQE